MATGVEDADEESHGGISVFFQGWMNMWKYELSYYHIIEYNIWYKPGSVQKKVDYGLDKSLDVCKISAKNHKPQI